MEKGVKRARFFERGIVVSASDEFVLAIANCKPEMAAQICEQRRQNWMRSAGEVPPFAADLCDYSRSQARARVLLAMLK